MSDAVTVTRDANGAFFAENGRGPRIPLGHLGDDGLWSPTELLRAALAGCAVMSAESMADRRVGKGAHLMAEVTGEYDEEQRRYTALTTSVRVQPAGTGTTELDSQVDAGGDAGFDAGRVAAAVRRTIGSACRVERTLEYGPHLELQVEVGRPAEESASGVDAPR